MTAGFGGLLAMLGAFCYALGSVAIAKSSQSAQGRGNDVFISVLMTAVASGVLWLLLGPELCRAARPPARAGASVENSQSFSSH